MWEVAVKLFEQSLLNSYGEPFSCYGSGEPDDQRVDSDPLLNQDHLDGPAIGNKGSML